MRAFRDAIDSRYGGFGLDMMGATLNHCIKWTRAHSKWRRPSKGFVSITLLRCFFCLNDVDHEYEEQEEVVMSSYERTKELSHVLGSKTILTAELERKIRYFVRNSLRRKHFLDSSDEDMEISDALIHVNIEQVLLDEIDRLRKTQIR